MAFSQFWSDDFDKKEDEGGGLVALQIWDI